MRITEIQGNHFLEGEGERVPFSIADLELFRKLNPMGRKVHMRRMAIKMLEENPNDSNAGLMLKFASLPVVRWALRFSHLTNLKPSIESLSQE